MISVEFSSNNQDQPSKTTVKPLIERHPVFSKIAVSDLLTGFLAVTIASSEIHFLLFFFFLLHANADAERGISR